MLELREVPRSRLFHQDEAARHRVRQCAEQISYILDVVVDHIVVDALDGEQLVDLTAAAVGGRVLGCTITIVGATAIAVGDGITVVCRAIESVLGLCRALVASSHEQERKRRASSSHRHHHPASGYEVPELPRIRLTP